MDGSKVTSARASLMDSRESSVQVISEDTRKCSNSSEDTTEVMEYVLYSEKSVTLFTVMNKVVIASRKAELKTYDLRLRTFVLIDSRGFRIEVW